MDDGRHVDGSRVTGLVGCMGAHYLRAQPVIVFRTVLASQLDGLELVSWRYVRSSVRAR